MINVQTDHQVVPLGNDRMQLHDSRTGDMIAAATRTGAGQWEISADGTDTVTVDGRAGAVTALTEAALSVLGGTGYSTTVPHGLTELE